MTEDPSPGVTVPPTAGLPLRLTDLWPGGDDRLDAALADWLGVPAVQIECSGTAALCVALTALKTLAPERHSVVVPAYTCPLVALAVHRCGLQLVVCDLKPDSFDFDPDALAARCDHRTLAVMPTHIGGRVADINAAQACARAVGAFTIEDAAQALGARRGGTSVGTACDIGFFSLAVGKGLTLFEGGVLVARTPALRAACRKASETVVPATGMNARGWELRRSLELAGYWACYRPAGLGWAYRRPLRAALMRGDWEAAAGDDLGLSIPLHRVSRWRRRVGIRALRRLPDFLAQGRQRAARRLERLRGIPGLTVLGDSPPDADGTWPVLLVLLPDAQRRNAVLDALWGAGCGLSLPFVHVLSDYPRYAHCLPPRGPGLADDLPQAHRLADRLLAISNSPWLDDRRFAWLCGQLELLLK